MVAALVVFLVVRFPGALDGEDERARLVQALLVLALVAGGLLAHRRLKPKRALRNAAVWLGIGAVLFVAYAFRREALELKDRLFAELAPASGSVRDGAVSFVAGRDGHFAVEAEVDGRRVLFLVDTGASDVVLSPADAERLGFDLAKLSFTRPYRTANGIGYGAPVVLGRVAVGPIALDDVRASVNRERMSRSLLGMSFLSRLSGYEVSRDTLTLRP
jgi:aspartyl protease family protein